MTSITYIIPTYNNLKLIKRCISSLVNQLGNKDKIIIIDDGSTDGTYEYLTSKYRTNKSIVILKQDNQGSGAARNLGIKYAKTEYIWFIDSDDYLVANAVKSVRRYLSKNSCDILYFNYFLKDTNETVKEKKLLLKYMDKEELMISSHFPWNKIFKTELFEEVRFPDKKIRFQDHATIPRLIDKAENIKYIDQPLYVYDISHDGNISKKNKYYNHMYISTNYLVNYFRGHGKSQQYLELILINTFIFNRIYFFRSIKEKYNEFLEIDKYLKDNAPEWKRSPFLEMKFWKRYKSEDKYIIIKIILGRLFSVSPKVTFTILYPFLFIKNVLRKK